MNAPPVDITCTACSPQEPTALIFNSQNCLKLRHALKTKGSSRQHQRILTWKSPFSFLDVSGKTTTVYTSLMVFLREPPWVLCCLNLKNMLAVWGVCSDIIINIVVWKASNILYSLGCFVFWAFSVLLWAYESDDFFLLILGTLQTHLKSF